MLRNQKGMTLVEIMIVVAIIGGLLSILGTQVTKQFQKSQMKQARIQLSEIGKAIDLYMTDCGTVPREIDALLDDPGDCDGWGPEPYLKESQLKDPWKNEIEYQKDGSNYILTSFGADGEEGGEGLDKDISSADM